MTGAMRKYNFKQMEIYKYSSAEKEMPDFGNVRLKTAKNQSESIHSLTIL